MCRETRGNWPFMDQGSSGKRPLWLKGTKPFFLISGVQKGVSCLCNLQRTSFFFLNVTWRPFPWNSWASQNNNNNNNINKINKIQNTKNMSKHDLGQVALGKKAHWCERKAEVGVNQISSVTIFPLAKRTTKFPAPLWEYPVLKKQNTAHLLHQSTTRKKLLPVHPGSGQSIPLGWRIPCCRYWCLFQDFDCRHVSRWELVFNHGVAH